MSATTTEATIRVRINHAHTLKDGWRLTETTVEWNGGLPVDWDDVAEAMRVAYANGVAEAEMRNDESAAS